MALDMQISPMDLLELPMSVFEELVDVWNERRRAQKEGPKRTDLRSKLQAQGY